MAKPVSLPRWIATGKIATPSTDKQDAGFDGAEQPPNNFFNWFWNLVYQWCLYLDTFGSHFQEFSGGVGIEGDIYFSGGAELVRYNNRVQLIPLHSNNIMEKPGSMTIAWGSSFNGVSFDDATNDFEPDLIVPIGIDWWVEDLKPIQVSYDLKGGTGGTATYVTITVDWRTATDSGSFVAVTSSPVSTASWVRHDIELDTDEDPIPFGAAVFLRISFTGGSTDLRADVANVAVTWSTEE